MKLTKQEIKEATADLVCPMCGGNMKWLTPEGAGTVAFKCESCPTVAFEYLDSHDVYEVLEYLEGRVSA